MIKAVIFDFFGVIGQSTYAHVSEIYNPTPEQSKQISDLHKTLDNGFINQAEFSSQYASILKITKTELYDIFAEAEDQFHTSKKLLGYIDSIRGEYKTALLSNVSSTAYHKFISPITSHFDEVITSFQVQIAKPDHAIFELTANRLGLDTSECLMVDDNQTNCEGALSVGISAICYSNYLDFEKQIKKYLHKV